MYDLINEFDLWLHNYGCNFADEGEVLSDSQIKMAIDLYSRIETSNDEEFEVLSTKLTNKYFPSVWQQLAAEMFDRGELNLCELLPLEDNELPF